jgi:DNA-binding IclR family transcriptional regulator
MKAMHILSLFSMGTPNWTLAQLSEKLKQPKSTLSNMLRTLEDCGLLQRDLDSNSYHLGLVCLELGYKARSFIPILPYAIPLLENLQKETGKIIYFTIPHNNHALYLEVVYPDKRKIHYSVVGKTLPMHCTGCGKAMLAYLPTRTVKDIIRKVGLQRFTESTITDEGMLFAELEKIRNRGYAIDYAEESPGVKCVAVPIINNDRMLGAVSVSSEPSALPDDALDEHAEKIMQVTNYLAGMPALFPSYGKDCFD